MIRLVAKVGLIIDFTMSSAAAESELVRKFNLQEVDPETILKLGKYGKIRVADIYGMSTRALSITTPKQEPQVEFANIFSGAFK